MKNVEIVYREIKDLKTFDINPRKITREEFKKLQDDIKSNRAFFEGRPCILSDRTGHLIIIAGNRRYQAAAEIGWKEVPTHLIPGLTEEEEKEIAIKDNAHRGDWDWQLLSGKEWKDLPISDWNKELARSDDEKLEDKAPMNSQTENEFSHELDERSNYVVLKFDRDVDFTQIETLLGLKSVYSRRQNGKAWSRGIGRVVNGPEAIKQIQNEKG